MNLLWAFDFMSAKDPSSGETISVDINDIKDEASIQTRIVACMLNLTLFKACPPCSQAVSMRDRPTKLREGGGNTQAI